MSPQQPTQLRPKMQTPSSLSPCQICITRRLDDLLQRLPHSSKRFRSFDLLISKKPFEHEVSLRRSGEGFLVEFWKGWGKEEKEKMGYITSAYGCNYAGALKGRGVNKVNVLEDCSNCCFPRFRGLAVSDGHRGVGLTSLMFSTYFKLIDNLVDGNEMEEGTKICTGRMRKPVLCSVLQNKWNFEPKNRRFGFYLLPSEEAGEKQTRVTGEDIGRIRSCFSNNYCKSQNIEIVPFDSSLVERSKLVYVETEYETVWASLVGLLNHEDFEKEGVWRGGLGKEGKEECDENFLNRAKI
mmetsp:Transcript_20951/g.43730  ORF Transcript_20951/g.43730 Transcript_20951/m.43730 type:complete len:296 (-) Transcript_20951:26-913(-)